ncbi:MAG TPA: ATP-binding protein [Nevskiaceae bacterium]|nr:ATP-binding protein [Nevskiaceae bacterium]
MPQAMVAEAAPQSLRSRDGELVRLIAEQTHRVPTARYLPSGLLGLLLLEYVPAFYAAAWVLTLWAVLWIRTAELRRQPEDPTRSDRQKLRQTMWLFLATTMAQAASMGFSPWVPTAVMTVITVYLVGTLTANLHATAGYLPVVLPMSFATHAPMVVAWSVNSEWGHSLTERILFCSVLCMLHASTMLSHARGIHSVFMESYDIRLQQLELTRRLQQSVEAAEEANRAKTRFLAAASHDLRQPLHALSLFSGSLLLRPLEARTSAIAQQIDQAVGALSSQFDALLDVSKLDAGIVERKITTVALHEMLPQLRSEFAPQAEAKQLHLELRCPPDLCVRTDPILFARIVRNLVSNAVKYTSRGSILLSAESTPPHCVVAVTDTGPGIPEAERERVFEEFYQLGNPERDRSKGLGLGLAIVRRLTELLEVELRLQSSIGEGSRFSVLLPLAADLAHSPPRETEEPAAVQQDIDVLVIDDEETIRLGMKSVLEGFGFGVCLASSTDEALLAAASKKPSIVLADFRLRRGDGGVRAIRALRDLCPGLPALLISGDTAPDRLREAHEAGVELLHKPVNAVLLRDSVLKALRT